MGYGENYNGFFNVIVMLLLLCWDVVVYINVIFGFDFVFKIGFYDFNCISVVVGYIFYQLVLVICYNDFNGLDLGIFNCLFFNDKNSDINYCFGIVYVVDFIGGWNFGKWKVGVIGFYLNQFIDDCQNGIDIIGNCMCSFVMGLIVVYNVGIYSINMNVQCGLYVVNMVKSDVIWINFVMLLWMGGLY